MRRYRKTIRRPETLRRRTRAGPAADAEVDLHGLTADQAVQRLRSALAAAPAGRTLLVVHGKGQGILRQRVRAFLRGQSAVREIRPGEEAGLPGGDGVTWCRLG